MLADKLKPFLTRFDELNTLLSDVNISNDISKMTALSKEQKKFRTHSRKSKRIS